MIDEDRATLLQENTWFCEMCTHPGDDTESIDVYIETLTNSMIKLVLTVVYRIAGSPTPDLGMLIMTIDLPRNG